MEAFVRRISRLGTFETPPLSTHGISINYRRTVAFKSTNSNNIRESLALSPAMPAPSTPNRLMAHAERLSIRNYSLSYPSGISMGMQLCGK